MIVSLFRHWRRFLHQQNGITDLVQRQFARQMEPTDFLEEYELEGA
jgi:hypothetical protein